MLSEVKELNFSDIYVKVTQPLIDIANILLFEVLEFIGVKVD